MARENDAVTFVTDYTERAGVVVEVGDFWTDVMENETGDVWQVQNETVTVCVEADFDDFNWVGSRHHY
jgi:hypothetical protein